MTAAVHADVEPAFLDLYERIADCPNCALARTRSRTVPGSGSSCAEVMFVGEAPGAREDEQGIPFVGPAGKFLDELLAAAGLSRETAYVANIVKCRPPGNRDPEPSEIDACRAFLDEQLAIVNPRIIVTLGRISMQRWFPGQPISRIHGQARTLPDGRTVVAMYHPAAALHNGALRSVIIEDFAKLRGLLEESRRREPVDTNEPAGAVEATAGATSGERLL